jgi:hypothetical protein
LFRLHKSFLRDAVRDVAALRHLPDRRLAQIDLLSDQGHAFSRISIYRGQSLIEPRGIGWCAAYLRRVLLNLVFLGAVTAGRRRPPFQ